MTPDSTIPRYRMRTPEGEMELDATEILLRFQQRRLHTSTLVCPQSTLDWHQLRFDPVLAPMLPKIHRRIRKMTLGTPWLVLGLCLLCNMILLTAVLLLTAAAWQIFLYKSFFYSFLVIGAVAGTLSDELLPERNRLAQSGIMIPLWGSWQGWRDFRRLFATLPASPRWAMVMNPLVWGCLLLFFIATWLAPATAAGGWVVLGLYGVFFNALALMSLPLLREARRRGRLWRAANPVLEPGKAMPQAKWQKRFLRRSIGRLAVEFLKALGIWLLVILLFWLPHYGIGNLRFALLKREIGDTRPLTLAAVPPAVPEPHAGSRLLELELPELPPSAPSAAETEAVLPTLAQIRTILRDYPYLGLGGTTREKNIPLENARKLLNDYCSWRGMESLNQENFDVPAFLKDLRQLMEYRNEDPFFAVYLNRYDRIISSFMAKKLHHLPDAVLAMEKEYVGESAEVEIHRRVAAAVWAENLFQTELLKQISGGVWGIQENIRATMGQWALEEIRGLEADYATSHQAYTALLAHRKAHGGIYQLQSFFEPHRFDVLQAENIARVRILRSLIACEQYRRRYGHFPATLSELVPEFLNAVPRDPFDGETLHYRPGEVIYSVGKDLNDDGGILLPQSTQDPCDIGIHFP